MKTTARRGIPQLMALVLSVQGTGCAGLRAGMSAADSSGDSANSSAGSNNSSQGSNNSSQGSNNSSQSKSGQSSGNSANSSDESGTSKESAPSSHDSAKSSEASNQSSQNSSNSSKSSDHSSQTQSKSSQNGSSASLAASAVLASTAATTGFAVWATIRLATPEKKEHVAAAMLWLRANRHQLQQDLAFGAGPALDDLAHAAEIRTEHQRDFDRILQRHRHELVSLVDTEELTVERAATFLSRIGELALTHPGLREDGESFVRRHASEEG